MLDVVIRNGRVVDGSGSLAFRADVGIQGDRIVCLGDLGRQEARTSVDAAGCVVSPGFIEIHGHSDYLILANPRASSKVMQGVTTEVAGNCGFSSVPLGKAWVPEWWVQDPVLDANGHRRWAVDWQEASRLAEPQGLQLTWRSTREYLETIEKTGTAVNYCQLVGHHALRAAVTGEVLRRPSEDELGEMERCLEQAMDEGAWGFSCGFDIDHDVLSSEFSKLSRITARYGGLFAFHIRSYDDQLIKSVQEAIDICREAGVRVAVSHLMAEPEENWGKVKHAVDMLECARAEGLPIAWDVLPFTMGGGNYFTYRIIDLLPPALVAGGQQQFTSSGRDWLEGMFRSGDPIPTRRRPDGSRHPFRQPFWDRSMRITRCPSRPELEGLTVAQAACTLGTDGIHALLDLVAGNWNDLHYATYPLSEDDLRFLLQHPFTMIGSDGGVLTAVDATLGAEYPDERLPHPRIYAAFPRIIRRYVRELGDLSLEEACRRMTSLPAAWFGLYDRGLLRPGMVADVIVFDPEAFEDRPDLHSPPKEVSCGLKDVLVSGVHVLRDGKETGRLPGQVLRPCGRR